MVSSGGYKTMVADVATVIVTGRRSETESPAERYARSLNIEPHRYHISEGYEKISRHLGATYAQIDLILEFNETPEDNKMLCAVLDFIEKNNRDVDGKLLPKMRQIILCYEKDIPKEFVECQMFCQKHKIPCNILWAGLFQTILERKEFSPLFNVIDLQLNLQDIPKSHFITKFPSRTHVSPILVPEDLADMVYGKRIVEEKLWYWDEKAAAAYLYLKDSPGYSVFYENYQILSANVREIVRTSFDIVSSCKGQQAAEETSYPALDFVALGVGSAEKELLILEEILSFCRYKNIKLGPRNRIHYAPIDVSFPLLQNSLRAVISRKSLQDALVEKKLQINPILTDFIKLHHEMLKGNPNKLIAALGLLWNVPANVALEAFKENLLTNDSLLLVDVEFIGGRDDNEISSSYEGQDVKEFCFHALELLNQASLSEENFVNSSRWGGSVSRPYNIFSNYSWENGSVEVEVVDSVEIPSLIKKYGLSSEVETNLRFGNFENTKMVVIMYVPKSNKANPVVLGYSTRYDYRELTNYVKDNFKVVKQYSDTVQFGEKSIVGYFLLRRQ